MIILNSIRDSASYNQNFSICLLLILYNLLRIVNNLFKNVYITYIFKKKVRIYLKSEFIHDYIRDLHR